MATMAPSSALRPRQPSARFEALVLDFLAHLEFERGLSRNTLAAYRTDLLQFGRFLAGRERDATTATAGGPLRLPRRARQRRRQRDRALLDAPPCTARRPACAPSTATCAARSSIDDDPAASSRRRGGARSFRRCSATARCRSCSPSRAATSRPLSRDRALLELMYASGLRASETISLEVGDVDLEHGVLRARGKGSKERLVPVGDKALAAVRVYLRSGRPRSCATARSRSSSSTSAAGR